MSQMPAPSSLVDRLWPATGESGSRLVRLAALAVFGSLLLWASAKVQVPFYPVPMTFQTAVVFLIGIAYGPSLGAATVVLYLIEGAFGLPVFAGTPEKGIGLPYMMGPTGGYLLGFVAAAAITGWAAQRSSHWLSVGAGVLVATIVIYILGAGWLATFVGGEKAWAFGIAPFLLGDAVKLVLVTILGAAGLAAFQQRLGT
ncbi:MAG: biotin transporter BioY [Geminicoccaceae bacterium]